MQSCLLTVCIGLCHLCLRRLPQQHLVPVEGLLLGDPSPLIPIARSPAFCSPHAGPATSCESLAHPHSSCMRPRSRETKVCMHVKTLFTCVYLCMVRLACKLSLPPHRRHRRHTLSSLSSVSPSPHCHACLHFLE